MKASASAGQTPAFCGSSPVLTWTKQAGRRPWRAISLGQHAGELRPVDGLDHVEQRDHVLRLVGLERADQVQLEVRVARASAGQRALASCT